MESMALVKAFLYALILFRFEPVKHINLVEKALLSKNVALS